jgi:hypothetical protein
MKTEHCGKGYKKNAIDAGSSRHPQTGTSLLHNPAALKRSKIN